MIRAYLYAAIAAALLALGTWWHLSRVHAAEKAVHAHYAVVLADIRDKTAEAAKAYRATEQAWQAQFEREAKDGQERLDSARRDADGARAAADSLRAALNRYRAAARATKDSSAPGAGPTADTALDLFADLLTGTDAAAGEIAEFADAAHAAGVTCERSADALMATKAQPAQPQ